jgi:hypothetical protein
MIAIVIFNIIGFGVIGVGIYVMVNELDVSERELRLF